MTATVNALAGASLASWLRDQRLAKKWTKAEMARRLLRAARAAGDNSVASATIMCSYVRRWERGDLMPTERYRLLYCTVLGIAPGQFGHGHLSSPAASGDVPGDYADVHIGRVDSIVLQIPDGCQQVVINLPCLNTRCLTAHAVAASGRENLNGRGTSSHVQAI